MEFKELTTVKFFGAANVKNCVSWSQDDKIAIVTQKGVDVLDLCLSRKCKPNELAYVRSFIPPSTDYPTHDTGIDANDVFINAERLEVYEMMFDPLLFSGISMTEGLPAETLQALWSPLGLADSQGCLLATRQSTGSVCIYQKKKSSWTLILNLSALRHHVLKSSVWINETMPQGSNKFAALKKRAQQLEATSMTWSQLLLEQERCWCFLHVAYRDGSIAAWKIERTGDCIETVINASISYQLNIGMERLCHISWHPCGIQGMLVLGDVSGIVRTALVENITTADKSSLRAQDMWDERDLIAVSTTIAFWEGDVWFVVAVKGSCLVVLTMNETGEHMAKCIANLGTLDIAAIQHVGDRTLMVITQCGSLNKMKIIMSEDGSSLELECHEMITKLDTKNYRVQGLGISKNKLVYAVTLTASMPYDHLLLREITDLVLFTFNTFENTLNNLQEVKHYNLSECWDYLELIRILGHGNWDLNSSDLENDIRDNPNLAWWLVILKVMEEEGENRNEELEEQQKRIEGLIMRRHVCKILQQSSKSVFTNQSVPLTSEEQSCIILMRKWLKQHIVTCESTSQDISDIPKQLIQYEPLDKVPELCQICSADVQLTSCESAICENGHTLPRCCLTLLACSVVPLRSCSCCKLVALPQPVFGIEPKCLYCSRPLELDDFF